MSQRDINKSKRSRKPSYPMRKYIFVTGGVVSSIGKGLTAASIGALLETRGLKVSMTKMDPYINEDPGTMSPFQHGEVFVTDDGAETDLDLGHYERFTNAVLKKKNSFTTGQVYETVIKKERRGDYLGGTVQVIPHITDQIRENILAASEDSDVAIIEVGGTVGDIESLPFLEAIRQFRNEMGRENAIFVHVTLIPFIRVAGELKTKPTQHSVKELLSLGIQPDILVCRADQPMPSEVRRKLSIFCNLDEDFIFESLDVDNIYKMPLIYHEQEIDDRIAELLEIWTPKAKLGVWEDIVRRIEKPNHHVKIAVVGKYMGLKDSYKSVFEALIHGGIANTAKVEVIAVDSETLTDSNVEELLGSAHGVLIPGGFGNRGIEGKILAIRYAREKKIPFFGICLGMQLACVEFARHVLNLPLATSSEFIEPEDLGNQKIPQIIHLMQSQYHISKKGGTMRLGSHECVVAKDSKSYESYQTDLINERHRHRYEFNNDYREQFEKHGLQLVGQSRDGVLVEMIEIKDHPWFVGCQFHPELKSKPIHCHPLFSSFIKAAIDLKEHS